ncbi:flavin-containing monooxygenase [Tsukamurella asaccharolytica]|nr:NAD(P)/FAD-dependent oxidoreductase [Tsukamurella asaccharolytica]
MEALNDNAVERTSREGVAESVRRWANELERALQNSDREALASLFSDPSYWRDNLAITWDFRQLEGPAGIVDVLCENYEAIRPANFAISDRWPAPELSGADSDQTIEAFLDFQTAQGDCSAYLLLKRDQSDRSVGSDSSGLVCTAIYSRLDNLRGFEPPTSPVDAPGVHGKGGPDNWLDQRSKRQEFSDRDPEVLVIGGGHAGIMVGRALQQLGIDQLIIDKNPRAGDSWRNRYYSLALHTPLNIAQFPDLPFPADFPKYLPKDKLANWMEFYVDAMDLNYWSSTEFVKGSYDPDSGLWEVLIRTSSGGERVMRPKHVIMATGGLGAQPTVPTLQGSDSFKGTIVHSSQFGSAKDFESAKVLVVGAGCSGHDVAADLAHHGVDTTMLQRSPIPVQNLETANLAYALHSDATVPTEVADYKSGLGLIYPILKSGLQELARQSKILDAELHRDLTKSGMRIDTEGEDGMGWLGNGLKYAGKYYLNVGASDLIIDGSIKVIQSDDTESLVATGMRMKDGSTLEFDHIVLATGYKNQRTEVERYFGKEVADLVGDVGGLDDDGEARGGFRPTAHPALWLMTFSFQYARMYSNAVAMQIKARLEGILPEGLPRIEDRYAGLAGALNAET